MGFGYLLIGYFLAFAFALANVYVFFDIIGGAVMLIGLAKLAPHGRNFLRAMWVDIAYTLLCLARVVLLLLGVLAPEGIVVTLVGVLIAAVSLILQFFVLAGIYFLAGQVELEKEQNRARRNILFIFLYYLAYVAAYFLTPYLGIIANFVSLAITVFGFVVLFLNLLLIHSCYCRICLKGQEDGARTPSRFAFVNRFNEKTDAMFDGAYLRPKKEKAEDGVKAAEEPGYLRVKRKKKSRRK